MVIHGEQMCPLVLIFKLPRDEHIRRFYCAENLLCALSRVQEEETERGDRLVVTVTQHPN